MRRLKTRQSAQRAKNLRQQKDKNNFEEHLEIRQRGHSLLYADGEIQPQPLTNKGQDAKEEPKDKTNVTSLALSKTAKAKQKNQQMMSQQPYIQETNSKTHLSRNKKLIVRIFRPQRPVQTPEIKIGGKLRTTLEPAMKQNFNDTKWY